MSCICHVLIFQHSRDPDISMCDARGRMMFGTRLWPYNAWAPVFSFN